MIEVLLAEILIISLRLVIVGKTGIIMNVSDKPSLGCSGSDRLYLHFVSGSKASIFVRKTLLVRPRDQKCVSIFTAHRVGPAFFDEDDVCAGVILGSLSELPQF